MISRNKMFKRIKNMKNTTKVYAFLAFFLTIAFMSISIISHSTDNIVIGQVAKQKYKAKADITNEVATSYDQEKAMEAVSNVYKRDETVEESVNTGIDTFFTEIEVQREAYKKATKNKETYISQNPERITFSEEEINYLVSTDDTTYNEIKKSTKDVTNEIFAQGVTEETVIRDSIYVRELIGATLAGRDSEIAYKIIIGYIEPNLIIDTEATEQAKEDAKKEVEPTVVLPGQTIVDEGDVITDEAYALLVQSGYVSEKSNSNLFDILSIIVFTSLTFFLFFLYIANSNRKIMEDENIKLVFLVIYLLAIITIPVIEFLPISLSPILFAVFLTSILVDVKLAYLLSVILPIFYIFAAGIDRTYSIFVIMTSQYIALSAMDFFDRGKTFKIIVRYTLFTLLLHVTILVLNDAWIIDSDNLLSSSLFELAITFLSGIIIVSLVQGSIPIWENVFKIVTPNRLMDLIKPSSPLLRRLTLEAPGTYHHSLVVANLAEEAAIELDANVYLVRAAAYYHDIGKLFSPNFYTENQTGENPHDGITPEQSARIIKRHVTYGMELAEENKLPKSVCEFIPQHHGDTIIKYFYYKAIANSGEGKVNIEDFRYPGEKPKTVESGILMLADSCEAASRVYLSEGKSFEEVEKLITDIFDDKITSGQLNDTNLTFKDVNTIKQCFLTVIKAMNHQRISYVEIKKDADEKQELEDEKLEGIKLEDEKLSEIKLEDAKLLSEKLDNENLDDENLDDEKLADIKLDDVKVDEKLDNEKLSDIKLVDKKLDDIKLDGENLESLIENLEETLTELNSEKSDVEK